MYVTHSDFSLLFRLSEFEGKLISWIVRECKPTKERKLLDSRERSLDFPGKIISLHVIDIY